MFAKRKQVYIFCDGSTGGRCAAAAIARSADGGILAVEWQVLSNVTNNEAEYAGLLLGIELARRLRAEETIFVLDSETVVCQMTGRCGVNSPELRVWHGRACAAVRGLRCVRYQAIPRGYNRLADGAAGQAAIPWEELMLIVNRQEGRA